MADESQDETPLPLGAQVLRKMHAALKSLHGECSKAVSSLDDCEAKTLIGEHMGTMESSFAGMAKAFGKLYKGVDLEEEEKKPEEKPAESADDKKKDPEPETKALDDEPDADDSMTPTEKAYLLSRIRKAESLIRHEERLQRMARLRAAN